MIFSQCATNIVGQGVFAVSDIATAYELINLQVKSMYINGCDIQQIISHSYLLFLRRLKLVNCKIMIISTH